jgi:hypothetical protein
MITDQYSKTDLLPLLIKSITSWTLLENLMQVCSNDLFTNVKHMAYKSLRNCDASCLFSLVVSYLMFRLRMFHSFDRYSRRKASKSRLTAGLRRAAPAVRWGVGFAVSSEGAAPFYKSCLLFPDETDTPHLIALSVRVVGTSP